MVEDVRETIWSDIEVNHRLYLPGADIANITRDAVWQNMENDILIGGLDREESCLVLSCLPEGTKRLFLVPLDKGLSGAKVFLGHYQLDSHKVNRKFVFKLDAKKRIIKEAENVENYVITNVELAERPIIRCGPRKALLVMPFARLEGGTRVRNLKDVVLNNKTSAKIVEKLFRKRLNGFYSNGETEQAEICDFRLDDLFRYYWKKVANVSNEDIFPSDWSELMERVERMGLMCNKGLKQAANAVLKQKIRSISTLVHGDLHAENILVQGNNIFPIDFAATKRDSSPLLDSVMLECSLKYIVIPMAADLETLIKVDHSHQQEWFPEIEVGQVPYRESILNAWRAIRTVREVAKTDFASTFSDYRKCLHLMTYFLAAHRKLNKPIPPRLNRPYMLASLYMLSKRGKVKK